MKILFTRFPLESRFGGAEVQTLSLMKGLNAKDNAIAFLGSCPVMLNLCREEGIPTVELDIGNPPVSKWTAVSFLWRKKHMQSQLEQYLNQFEHLDAIVMMSLSEKILLTPLALKKGIKVIWLEHDRFGRWLAQNPWLSALKKMSAQVTTVVVSDLSKALYAQIGWKEDHLKAIPNGIDPERTKGDSNKTFDDTVHIGCIARLTHDKGVDLLIEAIHRLQGVHLTIIGTGRDEDHIQDLVRKYDNVTLVAHIESLTMFYAGLDLFVLPSREHDPFGLVAAEAMMNGVPTIVTDVCGIASYLTNGTDAMIIEPDSLDAIRESINELIENNEKRLLIGERGKETAEKLFSIERMIEEYETVLSA